MDVHIRPFKPNDVDAMFFLMQRCCVPETRIVFGHLVTTLLDKDVAGIVVDLAESGPPQLVGVLLLRGEPWKSRASVIGVVVHPDLRGRGLGRRLMEWAARFAGGYDWGAVVVPVPPEDTEAQGFLEAIGFSRGAEDITPITGQLPPHDADVPMEAWEIDVGEDSES